MAGRPRSGRAYAWRTSKGRSRMLEVDGRFFVLLMSNGILIGLMYSLIALGFVLVYKATDAINFTLGEVNRVGRLVDEDEPERDQRVHEPDEDPVGHQEHEEPPVDLKHARPPLRRPPRVRATGARPAGHPRR